MLVAAPDSVSVNFSYFTKRLKILHLPYQFAECPSRRRVNNVSSSTGSHFICRRFKVTMPQCKECDNKFARPSTLKRHMASVHALLQVQYQCAECLEVFTRQDNLGRHVLLYHKDGLKQCQHCSGKYRRDYIERHESRCKNKARPRNQILGSKINTSSRAAALYPSSNEQAPKRCFRDFATLDNIPQGTDVLSTGAEVDLPDGALLELLEAAFNTGNGEFDSNCVTLRCSDGTTTNAQAAPTYDQLGRVRIYGLPLTPEDHVSRSDQILNSVDSSFPARSPVILRPSCTGHLEILATSQCHSCYAATLFPPGHCDCLRLQPHSYGPRRSGHRALHAAVCPM